MRLATAERPDGPLFATRQIKKGEAKKEGEEEREKTLSTEPEAANKCKCQLTTADYTCTWEP